MSSDYLFLKTGRGSDEDREIEDLTPERLKAVVVLFARNATEISQKFVAHQGRSEVTPRDLVASLKLQVFDFLGTENLLTKVKDIERELSTQEPIEVAFIENTRKKTTTEFPCHCLFCARFREVGLLWNNWHPKTSFEKLLRSNIERLLKHPSVTSSPH